MDKKRKNKKKVLIVSIVVFLLFVGVSYIVDIDAGKVMGKNFIFFATDMIKMFPAAFVLIGLFMVWIDRKTVEKYFGEATGFKGHLLAILLACTTLYPFVVVLPMAAALNKKGAKLGYVLTYLGASAICRVPMTIFEASFLGIEFTIIRYAVSLPLIVISSIFMEKIVGSQYLEKEGLLEEIDTQVA